MKLRNYSIIAKGILICLSLVFLTAAKPEKVVVSAASPNSAEQGTTVPILITGSGFADGASVAFWRTGTTNPGGITVLAVTVRDSQNITADIDVALAADIDNYDIEVKLSSRRKGKGTELFSVKLKGGGPAPDTTAPSLIDDFHTDRATSDSISLYWTAPGDDGDVGIADHYSLKKAAQSDAGVCGGSVEPDLRSAVDLTAPAPREAGRGHEVEASGLSADICYAFEITPFDEAGNTPGPSYATDTTQSAVIQGAWIIEDSVAGAYWDALFFDPVSGQPVVLTADSSQGNRHYTRSSDGTWSSQKVGSGKSSGNISYAYKPDTNTYGGVIQNNRNHPIYVELQAGGSWSSQLIIRDGVGLRRQGFAFDSNHMPAVVYRNGAFVYLARYNGSSFDIEQLPVSPSNDPSLRFHPLTQEPVVVYPANGGIHITTKTNGMWQGETLSIANDLWGPALLAFDPNDEPVILFKEELVQPFDQWIRMIRKDSSGNWDYNLAVTIDPDGIINQQHPSLVFADDGTLYVAMGNVGGQARVGRFCEEGRIPAFPCETFAPTRDLGGANVWHWETASEDAYTSGGGDVSIAIDKAGGTVAIVSPGSRYIRCNPESQSIICGNPPTP